MLSQGKPLELEPFQLTILADYFAGVRETLILIPKKNGKTTLLAALALFHLLTTDDAECVIGASTRDQASILYEQAGGFIRRTPGLEDRAEAKRGYREIRNVRDGHGRIRVLAADSDHADGVIPTLALVDELGRHKNAGLYGVFRDGLGPRGGQLVGITTAGEHEQSPLGVIRHEARKLPTKVEGPYRYSLAPDGSFAMHEWALEESDDLHDTKVVKTVNPASWQTERELAIRHNSPSTLAWQWARFACGVWLAADTWWITSDDWYRHEVEEGFRPGERIAIGFDGSRFHDATAIVGCRIDDGLLQLLALWEAPAGAREWEVPAGEVDARLAEIMERYRVVRGYFDPPLWQSEIDSWARDFGDKLVMRYWTNRAGMMRAAERFRTDIVGEGIPHVADERLTRHVMNTQLRERRGGYVLTKGRGELEANDAAIASVLAYEARCDHIGAGEESRGYSFA
jgi:Phage Terminase